MSSHPEMLLHCYVMGIGVIVGYAIEEVAVAGAVARSVAVDAVVAMAAVMAGAVAVVGAAAMPGVMTGEVTMAGVMAGAVAGVMAGAVAGVMAGSMLSSSSSESPGNILRTASRPSAAQTCTHIGIQSQETHILICKIHTI